MSSESGNTESFRRNLNALYNRGSLALARALRDTQIPGRLRIERARSGEAVPVYENEGFERRLYSLYAPGREAERLAATISPSQSVIVAGIGSGVHVRHLLESRSPVHVTVIPEPFELLVSLVRHFDFENLLSDPRVSVVDRPCSFSDESWEDLCEAASDIATSNFVPLFTRGLATMVPAGIVANFPAFAAVARSAVQRASDRISEDLTAQKRFGRLWMRNILLNLPRARASSPPPRGPDRIVVAAAGPSLEQWITANRNETAILSTDTAAPALEAHDVQPFAVVSVDPSPLSYHHVLCGSRCKRWILDIAANPLIWRYAVETFPLYSHHPLLTLLNEHDAGLEARFFSATDVTQTAVRLAAAMGAASIHVAGADFAYPKGSVYVRGSYIPVLFHALSGRMIPSQTRHFAFAYRSTHAYRDNSGTIHTPGLDAAKASMEATANELDSEISGVFDSGSAVPSDPDPGSGHSARGPNLPAESTPHAGAHVGADSDAEHANHRARLRDERETIRTTLDGIARELRRIPDPDAGDTPAAYYLSLSRREKQVINALVPAAIATPKGSWNEQLGGARDFFFRLISDLYQV
ncbi:MAG: 6-hydroxymethylpterin diphosphokinase MptE-like protein [Spirochaetota bacterium]